MKQKIIRTIMRPLLIVGVVLGLLKVAEAMAGNIDPSNNYAWGTNVGWLNFNSADSRGVTVYPDHLEGDVWAENVGWIRMGTHTDGGTHTYANTDSSNYGVNREADGSLSGYAWGTNVGWIKFDPDDGDPNNGGVSIDPQTGSFSGYAWAENVGWINFENTGANAYHVVVLVPDLVITKSVNPPTAQPGETITYTLTFSNAGDGIASGDQRLAACRHQQHECY